MGFWSGWHGLVLVELDDEVVPEPSDALTKYIPSLVDDVIRVDAPFLDMLIDVACWDGCVAPYGY